MTGKRSMFALRSILVILTVCLTFIVASESFCAEKTCPNVVGDWDYTSNRVLYDPATGYWYETHTGIFHITNQNDCVFYGTVEVVSPTPFSDVLTGAIWDLKTLSLTMTTGESSVRGILRKKSKKLYKSIIFSTSNVGVDENTQMTSQRSATRRE